MLSLADLYFVSPTFSQISTMDIPHLKTNNKNCITVRGIVQTGKQGPGPLGLAGHSHMECIFPVVRRSWRVLNKEVMCCAICYLSPWLMCGEWVGMGSRPGRTKQVTLVVVQAEYDGCWWRCGEVVEDSRGHVVGLRAPDGMSCGSGRYLSRMTCRFLV